MHEIGKYSLIKRAKRFKIPLYYKFQEYVSIVNKNT